MKGSLHKETTEFQEDTTGLKPMRSRDKFFPWFLLMTAIAIIMSGIVLWSIGRNNAMNTALDETRAQLADTVHYASMLARFLEIDGSVIVDRDLEPALANYEELKASLPAAYSNAIQRRIDRLNVRLANRNSLPEAVPEETGDDTASEYETRIKELEALLAQASNELNRTTESLSAEKDELTVKLAQARKELGSTQNTQVLSFTGVRGHKIHYLGEVSNGKAHGGGVGIWSTGSVYRGNWASGQRHGKGVFEWEDGQRYEGEYVHGIREGKGTYYWPGGDRYEGQWRADKRNGHGILYDMDGNVRYEGEWVDDKPVGGKS